MFTSKIATPPGPAEQPPCGRAWIYFRVRPGLQPGEVYLSFEQVVLCESYVNSAPLDAAWLWRSTDGGRTFPERVKTAEVPYADGYTSWVDASDSTVDSGGVVHAISYKKSNGLSTMLYQEGMHGTPVDIGELDNHSQLLVAPDRERFVFSSQNFPLGYSVAPGEAGLEVVRSRDGLAWNREFFAIPGYKATFWPNMLGPYNGSTALPHAANERVYGMLLAAQKPDSSQYGTLLFVRYYTKIPAPNLRVSAITASNREPREGQLVTLTATVANNGDAPAAASTTLFTLDGTTVIGTVATPAIPAGGTAQVTLAWNTHKVKGDHVIVVAADSRNVVEELREDDNTSTLAVKVKANKVKNGSFDDGSTGWSSTSTGAGTAAPGEGEGGSTGASLTSSGGNVLAAGAPSWTSEPIAVVGGQTLVAAASVRAAGLASPATVVLQFQDAYGRPVGALAVLASPFATAGFAALEQTVVVPPGAATARVVLSAFGHETATTGAVVFDDIGLFDG